MDLNVNTSLTYSQPESLQDGSINFVRFIPPASSYNAGDSISVKISSSNQFMCLQRSYMKFTITPSATGTLNPLGAVSVFNQVSDQLGGL